MLSFLLPQVQMNVINKSYYNPMYWPIYLFAL